jgi:hypothetical protein
LSAGPRSRDAVAKCGNSPVRNSGCSRPRKHGRPVFSAKSITGPHKYEKTTASAPSTAFRISSCIVPSSCPATCFIRRMAVSGFLLRINLRPSAVESIALMSPFTGTKCSPNVLIKDSKFCPVASFTVCPAAFNPIPKATNGWTSPCDPKVTMAMRNPMSPSLSSHGLHNRILRTPELCGGYQPSAPAI